MGQWGPSPRTRRVRTRARGGGPARVHLPRTRRGAPGSQALLGGSCGSISRARGRARSSSPVRGGRDWGPSPRTRRSCRSVLRMRQQGPSPRTRSEPPPCPRSATVWGPSPRTRSEPRPGEPMGFRVPGSISARGGVPGRPPSRVHLPRGRSPARGRGGRRGRVHLRARGGAIEARASGEDAARRLWGPSPRTRRGFTTPVLRDAVPVHLRARGGAALAPALPLSLGSIHAPRTRRSGFEGPSPAIACSANAGGPSPRTRRSPADRRTRVSRAGEGPSPRTRRSPIRAFHFARGREPGPGPSPHAGGAGAESNRKRHVGSISRTRGASRGRYIGRARGGVHLRARGGSQPEVEGAGRSPVGSHLPRTRGGASRSSRWGPLRARGGAVVWLTDDKPAAGPSPRTREEPCAAGTSTVTGPSRARGGAFNRDLPSARSGPSPRTRRPHS